jgi:myo-inositol-1(or 4)-monophosphatase
MWYAARAMSERERSVAIEVARAAGELLRREVHGDRRIEYKGAVTNLVTEMDARTEALIVDRLLAEFPGDAVLAEERGAQAGRSGRRWIIDPVDGTTNYAHALPAYAVSIALERAGRVELASSTTPATTSSTWPSPAPARSATTRAWPCPPPPASTRAC